MTNHDAPGTLCQPDDPAVATKLQQVLIALTEAQQLAELFKALSDPTRVRLLSLLAGHEVCVHTLAVTLEMSQSAISHQLRYLRSLRLVRFRKVGRHVYYTLDDQHIAHLFQAGREHIQHS